MRTRFLTIAAIAALLPFAAQLVRGAEPQYVKVGDIHIGGSGAFDYLTVDSAAKRLYITHGTEIVVIDTSTNAIVGRIADTPRVHGIAIAPGGRGFTSNGGENKVSIIDLAGLTTLRKVETGVNPDAILYEPKQKEIYALNHTGRSATVIGVPDGEVKATIALGGQAETGQADPELGRVFVNIEDKNTIDVIDIATHRVIASWSVAPAESPTGMAIDLASHRLFVGGGKSMVMIDARSGKVIASAPICGGTDATTYDPAPHMAFSSCGDGHITAVKVSGDALTVVQTIDTTRGARTMAIDPVTHRIYTAAQTFQTVDPATTSPDAQPPAGRGRGPAPVPDSFHVLVFALK
jgi:DNA-binding beta-propeller fold protein YncE